MVMDELSAGIGRNIGVLGPICQLAFSPPDFNQSLEFWTRIMKAGPFFIWHSVPVNRFIYNHNEITLDYTIAIGYLGDIQIEIMRQNDAVPSIFNGWNSSALHHIQLAAPDYDLAIAECERAGAPLVMEGHGAFGVEGTRFGYCRLPEGSPAGYVEFMHHPSGQDQHLTRRERMKAHSRGWDGSRPIRAPSEI
jgi:hypothetical protein